MIFCRFSRPFLLTYDCNDWDRGHVYQTFPPEITKTIHHLTLFTLFCLPIFSSHPLPIASRSSPHTPPHVYLVTIKYARIPAVFLACDRSYIISRLRLYSFLSFAFPTLCIRFATHLLNHVLIVSNEVQRPT